jgi:hypothetical protein
VPGKHLTWLFRHFPKKKRRGASAIRAAGLLVLAIVPAAGISARLFAETPGNDVPQPKFLGSQTCSSSSCHGGAAEKSNQYTIWSTHDFHHARPYATLETARSERLAEDLRIGNPTQSARCTVCHAPFATVPADRLGHDAQVTEGVSCETCHGPAENWLRSHTRLDYTHADRVAAGMRDLNNLYVRANTCVACHQNLDPEIRAAGHPELIFEMDGQCVTMPRHWHEEHSGAQSWFVGQAAAAREMSWQLANEPSTSRELVERWSGLVWVLEAQAQTTMNLLSPSHEDFVHAQARYDRLAKQFADPALSQLDPAKAVGWLAGSADAFTQPNVSKTLAARRAERLVLALDRLLPDLGGARTNAVVNESLNKLFVDAQSPPDFEPKRFAKDLNTFHFSVAEFLETK